MRTIAFLLLGLMALTGSYAACAMPADPPPPPASVAHADCPGMDRQAERHACVTASCIGCALPIARAIFPAPPISPKIVPPIAGAVVALVGIGPLAAIPPPRPPA